VKRNCLRSVVVALALILGGLFLPATRAQVRNFRPVTDEMLRNPRPEDWLMFSRTYDAQRFSPLKQITRENVSRLSLAWSRGMSEGRGEAIPIVYNGVMYVVNPGAVVHALDAATGDLLWEYKHVAPANVVASARTKTVAIYDDLILYTAPDGNVVGLDAATGKLRWKTYAGEAAHTSGPVALNGKVITGRACAQTRESCFIAAHDTKTGKELWKFFTVPGPGEPGYETWGNPSPETHAKNMASAWGLPGSYDPATNTVLWGVANPMPNTRAARHDGKVDSISNTAPSDLYSNSTLALDPDTGKLKWYYQHLPGDDWDEDYTNERILTTIRFNPNPKYVKWSNPNVRRGEARPVTVMMGEGGGIFVNDRRTGEFLWATPFPFDTPRFLIKNIDGETGKTEINDALLLKQPGENHLICFFNTTSFWPSSYHPGTNSIYIPYVDNCLNMTRASDQARERRTGQQRPEGKKEEFAGIAKVNLDTGELMRFNVNAVPSTGSTLATAGDVVFNGDVNRRFRAFDANTGKQLWETILGGPISISTLSYAVNGKQYVAVTTGDKGSGLARGAETTPPQGHNAIYVFALPQ
jgi:alcohol dehydrogenase (cytochrome c)